MTAPSLVSLSEAVKSGRRYTPWNGGRPWAGPGVPQSDWHVTIKEALGQWEIEPLPELDDWEPVVPPLEGWYCHHDDGTLLPVYFGNPHVFPSGETVTPIYLRQVPPPGEKP